MIDGKNMQMNFFEKSGIYISAISTEGRAIYKKEWGCPLHGERIITFHCTANINFINDLDLYKDGILYITKKLKKDFKQHTITITVIPSDIIYLSGEEN